MCVILSEFLNNSWPLFKIQRPKIKMVLQIQNFSHTEAFSSFALVKWGFLVHSPSGSCMSAPISSWQCLYDEVSTFSIPSWSLLPCFPLTMCVSACLSPDVFVSIFQLNLILLFFAHIANLSRGPYASTAPVPKSQRILIQTSLPHLHTSQNHRPLRVPAWFTTSSAPA